MLWGLLGELLKERLELSVSCGVTYTRLQHGVDLVAAAGIGGQLQRKINVAISPGEARLGYADDGVVLMNQLNGLADYVMIAVEVTLPERIAEHSHRLRVLTFGSIGGNQSSAKQCGHAKVIEAVSREVHRIYVLG